MGNGNSAPVAPSRAPETEFTFDVAREVAIMEWTEIAQDFFHKQAEDHVAKLNKTFREIEKLQQTEFSDKARDEYKNRMEEIQRRTDESKNVTDSGRPRTLQSYIEDEALLIYVTNLLQKMKEDAESAQPLSDKPPRGGSRSRRSETPRPRKMTVSSSDDIDDDDNDSDDESFATAQSSRSRSMPSSSSRSMLSSSSQRPSRYA